MTSHHLPVSLTSVRSWPQTGIAEHVRARIISDNALRQTGLGWLRKLAFPGINLRHAASSLPNRDFVGTIGGTIPITVIEFPHCAGRAPAYPRSPGSVVRRSGEQSP
jgi:hypothetical protein